MKNGSNLPKMSSRAAKALDVLSDGGKFRHGLERNSYTGRETFKFRLRTASGEIVSGVGGAAFYELQKLGFLRVDYSTSVASYYAFNAEAAQ